MENLSFIYMSTYLILLSYYIQNLNIYKNHFYNDYILNKNIIEEQLRELNKNLNMKYIYWNYQYTIFSIAITMLLLNLGGTYKYLFLGFSLFLLIQYIIEYHYFYIPTLIKMDMENKTATEILNDLSEKKVYKKVDLNDFQKNIKIKDLKTKEEFYSYILGEKTNKTDIKDEITSIYGYKENKLYELNLVEEKLYEIEIKQSKYYNSMYSFTTTKSIFEYGLIEPIFISIVLFISFI